MPDTLKEIYEITPDIVKNNQWLNLVLVGEQQGVKFFRGVSQSPTTGDAVHLVTISDLDIIYGGYDEKNSIDIGNISISESLSAIYKGVSQYEFDGLLNAPSVGSYLHRNIKNAYPYERIG